MMRHDSTVTTLKHIARVRELLGTFAAEMIRRGDVHDQSKFDPIEKEPLDEIGRLIAEEGNVPYGSDEYKRRTAMLGPMLEHHYANNSHHPEHYENGLDGMDLFDVVEMFFDWKAASERGEESAMNISSACSRFEVSEQLEHIFENTADRLNFKHA